MPAAAGLATDGAVVNFDVPAQVLIQPDFDLEGGAELRSRLMAVGLTPSRGMAGLAQSDRPQIVFLAANRHHPVLVERLRRARAIVPNARQHIVARLSSPCGLSGAHADVHDTMEEALRVAGLMFLTSREAWK